LCPSFAFFSSRSQETHIKAHSGEVRITHPAHPLQGQSFSVMQHQIQKDPHVIEIQLPDGERRFVPLDWTDRAPPVVTVPGARFLLANLLAVRQRLDLLLQTPAISDTLPPNHTQLKEGGSDANPPSVICLVATDRGATNPGDCYLGADVAAPTDETTGG
jgi:hypothetical protein